MQTSSTNDLARERITRVFRYLAELQRLRTPPARRLEDYDWRLTLSELPAVPTVRVGRVPSAEALRSQPDSPGGDDFVLKVRRPRETPCPPPPAKLHDWLVPGWQKLDGAVEVVPGRNHLGPNGETTTEQFADDPDRVRALDEWTPRREAWREAERPVRKAMELFRRLFDLWGRLERESEKLELVLGEGVLLWERPDGPVRHPLLLQKLHLEFDPQLPEFTVRETDHEPELYTPLLHALEVDGQGLAVCRAQLEQGGYHPLGGGDTTGFLEALVHRLWHDGELLSDTNTRRRPETPQITRDPVIYLGARALGFAVAIEALLERLPTTPDLPPALVRVVGVEQAQNRAEATGEPGRDPALADNGDIDLLFTKSANPEQERIARRLTSAGCVLVQGPPGTGKTHTIGNLIGHLLAQGKSILVTSHTAKALRVVRENVVPALRPLCVSALDSDEESRRQLEAAVGGIVSRLSTTDAAGLEAEAAALAAERERLKERIEQAQRELRLARRDEYSDVIIAGEGLPPAVAARRVGAGRPFNDWVPGPVEPGRACPLSLADLRDLYALNATVSADDERDLRGTLPSLDSLPTDEQFRALGDELSRLEGTDVRNGSEFWLHDSQKADFLDLTLEAAREAVSSIAESEPWFLQCALAGHLGGAERAIWDDLIEKVEETNQDIGSRRGLILELGPRIDWDRPLPDQVRICSEILTRLSTRKGISILSRMWNADWREFVRHAFVDSGVPKTAHHFQALLALLHVRLSREALARRWDRQMGALGAAIPATVSDRPEGWCRQFVPRLRLALDWYATTWRACERVFEANGLNWKAMVGHVRPNPSPHGELLRIRDAVRDVLPPIIESRRLLLAWRDAKTRLDQVIADLAGIPEANDPGGVVQRLREAARRRDAEEYARAWLRLVELHRQREPLARRESLLRTLEPIASGWAAAIRRREAPHGAAELPGDPHAAWQHRQWEQELRRRASRDLDRLQRQLGELTSRLHDVTAEYVDRLTWAAQLHRTGLTQQQALVGWLGLVRRIGKGTGIRAPALKAAARRRLSECKSAVPVWIMPLTRVAESYDFRTTSFDVVVLDEASQSDVLGLLAFALGKEVIVVGDNEQVSPDAVGQSLSQVSALIETYLAGIPNKELYDGKTSVYDLARMSFGGAIRLVEHFRCVPEVIQFSNHLCYEGEIKPLREASEVVLRPRVVAHRVRNGDYVGRVNQAEAIEVASLVVAASQLSEYANATMGVVSLVGEEQAREIDQFIREHMPEIEYKNRRVVCGNAAHFQGDERQVMFLSLVETTDGGPLPLRAEDRFRQRFNVAASRARDQMWVVHSLNPDTDLKAGDLRLRLIRHAEDPTALVRMLEQGEGRVESEFERQVLGRLVGAGYRVRAQWPVGAYRIDLVVEGERGRVGIECDGDRYHPIEGLDRDFERQRVLERLGWRFIRLRGSEFFLDADSAMTRVCTRLGEMGIEPIGPVTQAPVVEDDAIHLRVLRRAEELRRQWAEEGEGEQGDERREVPVSRPTSPEAQTRLREADAPMQDTARATDGTDQRARDAAASPTRAERRGESLQPPKASPQAAPRPIGTDAYEGPTEMDAPPHRPSGSASSEMRDLGPDGVRKTWEPDPRRADRSPPRLDEARAQLIPFPDRSRSDAGAAFLSPYRNWTQRLLPDPQASPVEEIVEGLVEIIRAEGPVICHRVYRLYVKAAGGQRVGRQIRAVLNRAIRRAIKLGLVEERNEHGTQDQLNKIVRTTGTPPISTRTRGDRSFEEIPPDELHAAVQQLRQRDPLVDRERVVRRVAELYEIGRLTTGIKETLESIIAREPKRAGDQDLA